MQTAKLSDVLEQKIYSLKTSLLEIEKSKKLNIDLYFHGFMKGKQTSIKNEIYFLESIKNSLK